MSPGLMIIFTITGQDIPGTGSIAGGRNVSVIATVRMITMVTGTAITVTAITGTAMTANTIMVKKVAAMEEINIGNTVVSQSLEFIKAFFYVFQAS
jgi:hypothetical protein